MAKGKNGNNEGSIRKRKNGTWEGRYTIGYDALSASEKTVHGKGVIPSVMTRAAGKNSFLFTAKRAPRLQES